MKNSQFCVKKNFLLLVGILLLVIGGLYFSTKINKSNLSYKSEAANLRADCGNVDQPCCAGDKCSYSFLKCYSPEMVPDIKKCTSLSGKISDNENNAIKVCGGSINSPCCENDNSETNDDIRFYCNRTATGQELFCNSNWIARTEYKHLNPWNTGRCELSQQVAGGLGEPCRGNFGDKNRCDVIETSRQTMVDDTGRGGLTPGKIRLHCYKGIFNDGSVGTPLDMDMCGMAEILNKSSIYISNHDDVIPDDYNYFETYDTYAVQQLKGIKLSTNAIAKEYQILIDCNIDSAVDYLATSIEAETKQGYPSHSYRVAGRDKIIYTLKNIEEGINMVTDDTIKCFYLLDKTNYKLEISLWAKESQYEDPYEIKSITKDIHVDLNKGY